MNFLKPPVLLLGFICFGGCWNNAPTDMIVVTGGTFPMGTDKVDRTNHALSLGLEKPWFADESPEHRVTVKTFYLDRLEVTNKDYYIFIHATNHKPPPHWNGLKFPNGQGNFPVTNLTFFEAASFAEWAGKRLPTEIEWERASRGPNNWIYPWGNKFQFTMANISQSNKKTKDLSLKPVGSYPQGASAFGIEDMIGNAWEWVWDYYQPYPGNQYQSAHYGKKYIIVRGLSFFGLGHFPSKEYKKVVALKARASYREKLSPFARKIDVGFRCAMDRQPITKKLFKLFMK